ncbi:hypothetical protein PHMEG_00029319 [Phytophthora megakarya]|uniref:Uncharacterized protein n=1 Tax=Phytophthora megakarya TaxID=4795 RepID=A0A225V2C3_9STRA|nr:hypothetical protein PHMEG_00029319 [Phytophthora megakarya]
MDEYKDDGDDDMDSRSRQRNVTSVSPTECSGRHHGNTNALGREAKDIKEESKTEEASSQSYHGDYGSQSPWDPEAWQGDMEEIQRRMNGPTIHHSLKQEVEMILRHERDRTAELLRFFVATVSQTSMQDQERLLSNDLNAPEQCAAMLAKYHIAKPVLKQWKECILADRTDIPVSRLEDLPEPSRA